MLPKELYPQKKSTSLLGLVPAGYIITRAREERRVKVCLPKQTDDGAEGARAMGKAATSCGRKVDMI
jgi:hypothetical protein